MRSLNVFRKYVNPSRIRFSPSFWAAPAPAPGLRPGLLGEIRQREPGRPLAAEGVAVLEADAATQEEAVEEPDLVLEKEGTRVDLLAEGPAVPPALVPVLEAERQAVHGARVPGAQELELAPPGVDLGVEGEVGAEHGRHRQRPVPKALGVPPLAHPGRDLPPREELLIVPEREEVELVLLLGGRVAVEGEEALVRHVGGRFGVAAGRRGGRVPGQINPEPAGERGLVRIVVVEGPLLPPAVAARGRA